MKIGRRPEPVVVAITSDDLWLEVICQTSLEIAGSPRKVYRDRVLQKRFCGRALNGTPRVTEAHQSNSECKDGSKADSHIGLS
jgi:hypothetical protein